MILEEYNLPQKINVIEKINIFGEYKSKKKNLKCLENESDTIYQIKILSKNLIEKQILQRSIILKLKYVLENSKSLSMNVDKAVNSFLARTEFDYQLAKIIFGYKVLNESTNTMKNQIINKILVEFISIATEVATQTNFDTETGINVSIQELLNCINLLAENNKIEKLLSFIFELIQLKDINLILRSFNLSRKASRKINHTRLYQKLKKSLNITEAAKIISLSLKAKNYDLIIGTISSFFLIYGIQTKVKTDEPFDISQFVSLCFCQEPIKLKLNLLLESIKNTHKSVFSFLKILMATSVKDVSNNLLFEIFEKILYIILNKNGELYKKLLTAVYFSNIESMTKRNCVFGIQVVTLNSVISQNNYNMGLFVLRIFKKTLKNKKVIIFSFEELSKLLELNNKLIINLLNLKAGTNFFNNSDELFISEDKPELELVFDGKMIKKLKESTPKLFSLTDFEIFQNIFKNIINQENENKRQKVTLIQFLKFLQTFYCRSPLFLLFPSSIDITLSLWILKPLDDQILFQHLKLLSVYLLVNIKNCLNINQAIKIQDVSRTVTNVIKNHLQKIKEIKLDKNNKKFIFDLEKKFEIKSELHFDQFTIGYFGTILNSTDKKISFWKLVGKYFSKESFPNNSIEIDQQENILFIGFLNFFSSIDNFLNYRELVKLSEMIITEMKNPKEYVVENIQYLYKSGQRQIKDKEITEMNYHSTIKLILEEALLQKKYKFCFWFCTKMNEVMIKAIRNINKTTKKLGSLSKFYFDIHTTMISSISRAPTKYLKIATFESFLILVDTNSKAFGTALNLDFKNLRADTFELMLSSSGTLSKIIELINDEFFFVRTNYCTISIEDFINELLKILYIKLSKSKYETRIKGIEQGNKFNSVNTREILLTHLNFLDKGIGLKDLKFSEFLIENANRTSGLLNLSINTEDLLTSLKKEENLIAFSCLYLDAKKALSNDTHYGNDCIGSFFQKNKDYLEHQIEAIINN